MNRTSAAIGICCFLFSISAFAEPPADSNVKEILDRFVSAWKGEKELGYEGRDRLRVAFRIHDGKASYRYHADLHPEGGGALREGASDDFLVEFELDVGTLSRLDQGKWSPNTALGAEFDTDETPLTRNPSAELARTDRYWETDEWNFIRKLTFHFWNRDWPETIAMGERYARNLHGANSVLLYYENDLRVGWFQLKQGMAANEDERLQTNPFPSLLIVTEGSIQARIDGRHLELEESNAVFIPPEIRHRFWVEGDQQGGGILLMFE